MKKLLLLLLIPFSVFGQDSLITNRGVVKTNKMNYTDTSSMLSPYLRNPPGGTAGKVLHGDNTWKDTTATGAGTVTNIANGYAILGGPITSTGTLRVDSSTLSSYFIRRKDSSIETGYYPYSTNPKNYLTTIDTTNIASFSVKVHSIFSASLPVIYNSGNGKFSVDTGRIATQLVTGGTLNNVRDSLQTNINEKVNYAQLAYIILGGAIKAEPITGNIGNISTLTTFVDQVMRFVVIYNPKRQTITGVKWWQSIAGSYTSSNYNGVALYSLSAGTMTLIDTSVNDGNIWKASQGFGSKIFLATHVLDIGVYVIGALYCRSAETTAPGIGTYGNLGNSTESSGDFTNSVKLHSTLSARTTVPTSQAMSGTTVVANQVYLALY